MYLKTITLRGFKSFKSKSTLTFEPGISVVVGPNGSGKSNIADAISWVLGEQSPKSLRGSSMGDVIFRNRQEEMGIAEVSLVFDNRDRTIDLDFSDVRITRRVYLEGGSDYFINSSPTRLMDIQDLLAATGIGKGLYTIINQGQINEIAMLKPVERKLIIDEVVGIAKHKNRRDKALLKLGRVKEDIGRIDDLLEEIKRTMVPLEVEAGKAREYSGVLNQLKSEEISFFMSELNRLNEAWKEKNEEEASLRKKQEESGEELARQTEKYNNYKNEISEKLSQYRYWENTVSRLEHETGRLDNMLELIFSKVNVFSTLSNMFDRKTATPEQKKGDSVYRRLKDLQMLVHDYTGKVAKILSGYNRAGEIDSQARDIHQKINQLLDLFREDMQKEQKKEERQKINLVFRQACIKNLKKAKKLLGIVEAFKKRAHSLEERIYPHFKEVKKDVEQERALIDQLGKKLNEIRMENNSIENKLYRHKLDKEQIKEKTENITTYIVDNYNLSIDYILKNYEASGDIERSQRNISRLKKKVKEFGNINPNASIEYERIKKRYDFLNSQRNDLVESKGKLEKLIEDVEKQIMEAFLQKFEQINKSFSYYFKILFPVGEGELMLLSEDGGSEFGVDLKVDIGNNKFVPLSLLSGGEKTLVSIAFLFSIFSTNLSPFYVFDEADAALDDVNIDRFLSLVRKFAERQQIILITHQKKTMEIADTIYGVSMQSDGVSKIVSEKISDNYAKTN
ncbi:MAG: chromosome segregation SMC family protein [Actinomycetota bacterium]